MTSGIVRKPRAVISVGGGDVIPIECTIDQTGHKSASTFHATITLDGTPGLDERFWSDTAPIPATVLASSGTGGWATMFVGEVDSVDIDLNERTAHISGRDKTAKLLETKTTEKWQNRTTPEIVQDIAGRVGLTADVQVSSPDKVGLIFKDDYNRISDQDVLYNVLTRLAQREGCSMFVNRDRLIFKPEDQLGGGVYPLVYVRPTPESYAVGNWVRLRMRRNLAVAKGVKVKVQSWQQKQEKQIDAQYGSEAGGGSLDYTYRAPNLTKQQADKLAKARHDEVVGRERSLDVDAPGDVTVDPEMLLQLSGTGTGFDQSYMIAHVSHSFSGGGYRMTISTRNKDKKRKGRQIA